MQIYASITLETESNTGSPLMNPMLQLFVVIEQGCIHQPVALAHLETAAMGIQRGSLSLQPLTLSYPMLLLLMCTEPNIK